MHDTRGTPDISIAPPIHFTDSVETRQEGEEATLDVDVERLPGAEGRTRNFVLINGPVFQARTADKFLGSLKKKVIDTTDRPDAIRQNLEGEMLVTDGVWELRVQLCRDLEKQPIENPTVEWQEADSPFQTVATIHVGRQDSWDAGQVQKVDEEMRFSPWIGLAAHRPLGNINRARKEPYEHSAEYRARFNRCPIHEPSGAQA